MVTINFLTFTFMDSKETNVVLNDFIQWIFKSFNK